MVDRERLRSSFRIDTDSGDRVRGHQGAQCIAQRLAPLPERGRNDPAERGAIDIRQLVLGQRLHAHDA